MLNKSSPRLEPWGIPHVILVGSDVKLPFDKKILPVYKNSIETHTILTLFDKFSVVNCETCEQIC